MPEKLTSKCKTTERPHWANKWPVHYVLVIIKFSVSFIFLLPLQIYEFTVSVAVSLACVVKLHF